MLPLLLFAQLAAAPNSAYSSEAVRDLVARAVIANRTPPPELRGYNARVKSEFSINIRDTLGRECAGQIERRTGCGERYSCPALRPDSPRECRED